MTGYLAATARWYGLAVWSELRDIWTEIPGPWPVKLLVCALVVVLTQAIPGQLDDVLVIGALRKACQAWNRRQAAATGGRRP